MIPPCARDIFLPHVGGQLAEPMHYAVSWHHARRMWPDADICAIDDGLTADERVDLGLDGILILDPFAADDEPPPHEDHEAPADISPPWPEKQPLPPMTPPAPELPPELIPEPLRGWITGEADDLCTPLVGVAAPALVALSAIMGRGATVSPEPGNPWRVIPNLWGCTVAPPGLLKSPALAAATAPLEPLIKRERERFDALESDAIPQRMALEAKLSKAKRRGDADPHDLRRIMDEIEDCKVSVRRYSVQDASLEKLQEIQRDNPRGLLLLRDELAGWLATLAKQGHEADRGYYLEAWDGDKSSTIDRIGRGTIYVPANCLALYGTIQPARLAPLIRGVSDGTSDDGLLQRMQVLVFVDTLPEWAPRRTGCSDADKKRAFEIFDAVDQIMDHTKPKDMIFSFQAQEIFDEWRSNLEQRIRRGDLHEQPIKCGHLAKYRSLTPSLAAIFHTVIDIDRCLGGGAPAQEPGEYIRITADCARLAIAWCEYLEQHVDRLHARTVAPEIVAAHALAAKIETGEVSSGDTIRGIYRNGWAGLSDNDTVDRAVNALERLGHCRREIITTGGRPSTVITLNNVRPNDVTLTNVKPKTDLLSVLSVESGTGKYTSKSSEAYIKSAQEIGKCSDSNKIDRCFLRPTHRGFDKSDHAKKSLTKLTKGLGGDNVTDSDNATDNDNDNNSDWLANVLAGKGDNDDQ